LVTLIFAMADRAFSIKTARFGMDGVVLRSL